MGGSYSLWQARNYDAGQTKKTQESCPQRHQRKHETSYYVYYTDILMFSHLLHVCDVCVLQHGGKTVPFVSRHKINKFKDLSVK